MRQSYIEHLQKNFADRTSQEAYVSHMLETDPRLQGLSHGQAAQVLADVTGHKPLERFNKGAITRGLDYAGNLVNEVGMNASPADLTARFGGLRMDARGSDAMEVPFSQRTGDMLEGASRWFGAEEDTQKAFRTAGEGIPAIAGQMAMAAIPGVGLPAMLSTMYGQGLDQAYSQGETGAIAHVSGALGPAISMATIGLARPLSSAAANKVMTVGQKLMGKGAADVIREGMEVGGELGLKRVIANKAIDYSGKVALKVGQEALVETAQAGIGIAGEIAQAAILDPKEFVTNTMFDKQFWIPVITSELIEGVGGTVIGRVRNPLVENADTSAPEMQPQDLTEERARLDAEAAALKNDPTMADLKAAAEAKLLDFAKMGMAHRRTFTTDLRWDQHEADRVNETTNRFNFHADRLAMEKDGVFAAKRQLEGGDMGRAMAQQGGEEGSGKGTSGTRYALPVSGTGDLRPEELNEITEAAVAALANGGRVLGRGGNNIVYDIPGTKYVLRAPRAGWGSDKDPTPSLTERFTTLPDPFPGRNFGQAVAKSGNVQLLLRQEGVVAGLDPLLRVDRRTPEGHASNKANYDASIQRTASLPQAAFDQLARDLRFISDNGFMFDPSKASNLLVDVASGRFNIVDVGLTNPRGYSFGLGDMLVPLMDNGHANFYRGPELTPYYQQIFDKSVIAAQKAGLGLTLDSSAKMSAQLAGREDYTPGIRNALASPALVPGGLSINPIRELEAMLPPGMTIVQDDKMLGVMGTRRGEPTVLRVNGRLLPGEMLRGLKPDKARAVHAPWLFDDPLNHKPLYVPDEAVKRGIDPNDPEADEKIVEHDKASAQVASAAVTEADVGSKTAPTTVQAVLTADGKLKLLDGLTTEESMLYGDDQIITVDVEDSRWEQRPDVVAPKSTHVTPTEAVVVHATNLKGKKSSGLHVDPLKAAELSLKAAEKSRAPGVTPEQAKARHMEIIQDGTLAKNKDHRILTDPVDPTSHISFRNPATAEVGILTHIVRKGKVVNPVDASGKKTILTLNDMMIVAAEDAVDPAQSRARLNAKFGMELEESEFQMLTSVARRTKEQYDAIPTGFSFGEGLSKEYVNRWTAFFEQSGVGRALQQSGIKLRLGSTAYKVDHNTLKNSPLDYFGSLDKANNTKYFGGDLHYVSRYRGTDFRARAEYETDLHEVGHTVGDLVRNGAFGADVQAEWTRLMDEAVKLSTDDDLVNRMGVKIAYDVAKGAGAGEIEIAGPEGLRKHYRRLEEIEAQTFQGYMLGKDNKWKNFVKTHFPNLHKFFTKFVESLGLTSADTKELADKKMDLYSAKFAEAEMLLKGIFNNHYNNVYNGKKRLQALKRDYKLNGTLAGEALHDAWMEANKFAGHSTINDALAEWHKGLEDKQNPSAIEQTEIIELLEYVKKFNEINYRGFTNVEESFMLMPWASRLGTNSQNLAELRERILMHGKPNDVVLQSIVDTRMLTPEQLAKVESDAKILKDGSKIGKDARALLDRRDKLALSIRFMGRAVDEIFAKTGEHRVRPGQVVKQMFQVDNTIKLWFLGRLPGQEGIPMNEPKQKGTLKELYKDSEKVRSSRKDERPEFLHTINKWYPILSKELFGAIATSKAAARTYVATDGSVVFGRKEGRNNKRKYYDTREEAESAALVIRQQPGNLVHKFSIESYKRPKTETTEAVEKFVLRVTKTADEQTDMSYIDDFDPDAAEASMTRVLEPQGDNAKLVEQRTSSPDDFDNSPTGRKILEAKKEYIRQNQTHIMAKAHEFAPVHVEQIRKQRQLPARLQKIEDAMQNAFIMKPSMQRSVAKLAQALGVKNVERPSQLISAWLGKQFDRTTNMDRLMREVDLIDPNLAEYVASYTNFAKTYVDDFVSIELGKWLHSESRNMLPDVDPSELGAGARGANNSPMMQKEVREGVIAANRSQPGGPTTTPGILKNALYYTKKIFGAVPASLQAVHNFMGQGPIHTSMTDPDFVPLGNFIHTERRNSELMANESLSHLYSKGSMKEFVVDGKKVMRFVKDINPIIDKNSPLIRIAADPEKAALHNDLIRLEQSNHMAFADQLVSTVKAVRESAQELWARIPEADRQIHEEACARRYAAQIVNVRNVINNDRNNQVISFGRVISFDNAFDSNADQVMDFAKRFSEMPPAERIQALVNELNKSPIEANDIVLKYGEAEEALLTKHQFLTEHPEYVDEKRFKNFHVSVVFKKGYKSKSGIKHKDDTVLTGYYDFDTLNGEDGKEGAYQFIKRMRDEGHKVPDHPKDFQKQKYNYKPASGSLEEIMHRVLQSRKDLISTLLYGKALPEDIAKIENVMDSTVSDILAENDIVKNTNADKVRRKFVEGRENLDMIEQFMASTKRKSASMARRQTDMMFSLYERDKRMLAKEAMWNKMVEFKDGVRLADTDLQRNISAAGFTMFMGFNISSGLVEMFQFPMTLSPMLMEIPGVSARDAYGIPAKMYKRAMHASMTRVAGKDSSSIWLDKSDPDRELFNLMRTAEDQGLLAQSRYHDISQGNTDNLIEMHKGTVREAGVVGVGKNILRNTYSFMNTVYGGFNRINAELGLASTYMVLKKNKYGLKARLNDTQIRELQGEAMKLSDMANGSLQRLGRPSWFNTKDPSNRAALSAYWSLQSFVNAQVANQIRFMSKAIDANNKWTPAERAGARKAFVGLLGAQFAGMGVMGFTLMPAISKLVEQAFGFDMEEALRGLLFDDEGKDEADKNFMGEMATNGILSAMGTPIDFGTRISIAGVGPLSGFEGVNAAQVGGPLLGLATQAFKDVMKVKEGKMEPSEMAVNALPMGLRRAARLAFFDNGKVYDSNKNFMFEPTFGETVGMVAGFTPMRARKEMKARMEQYEAQEGDSKAKRGNYAEIMRLSREGSIGMMQNLIERTAQEHQMNPYDVAAGAASMQVNKDLGPSIREGAGPRAMNALKLFPSSVEPNKALRMQQTWDKIRGLGFKPKENRRALRKAHEADMMQSLFPELPSSMASRLVARNPHGVRQAMADPGRISSMQELLQQSGGI